MRRERERERERERVALAFICTDTLLLYCVCAMHIVGRCFISISGSDPQP